MLVRLIVTGRLEFLAMSTFLGKIFPGATFETEQVDSFTSNRLCANLNRSSSLRLVDKLAEALIAAVDPGRKKPNGGVPDLVVAIDDLELCNLDQPQVITQAVRHAVSQRVPCTWSASDRQNRCFDLLRKRASFHLLSPMIEAYFFTCEAALQAAQSRLPPKLVQGHDVEDFVTNDELYLSEFRAFPVETENEFITPQTQIWFQKHPKKYLEYLVSAGATNGVTYREAKQGTAALKSLEPTVALSCATQQKFLRSLIHDIADGLDMPLPIGLVGECHSLTSASSIKFRVLRNI